MIFSPDREWILGWEFKVYTTPKDDEAVHRHSLAMALYLKEDLIFEFVLMQKYGISTVLPFSKYATSIVAETTQRKKTSSCRPHGNQ